MLPYRKKNRRRLIQPVYTINMEPLIINCCLTGNVPTKKHTPHIPLASDEIIRDAREVIEAGATMLHIHARDKDGEPTYKKSVFAETIRGIRKISDKVIICVTTSGRKFKKFKQRSAVLELKGYLKPDFASFTLGSFNFPKESVENSPPFILKLADKMKASKILPEWEIFEPGMLNYGFYLVKHKLIDPPRWINFFLGSLGTSPATPELINLFLTLLKPTGWRFAFTGVGRFQHPVNLTSLEKGGHIRVGLEDNWYMDPDKTELATNRKLVERIVSIAKSKGRKIATVAETRSMLLD